MNMWDAMLADIKAMDKFKGSLSSDLVAHCRIIRAAFDEVPAHMQAELCEAIVEKMRHFGVFFSPKNHSVLGPTLKALGHTF